MRRLIFSFVLLLPVFALSGRTLAIEPGADLRILNRLIEKEQLERLRIWDERDSEWRASRSEENLAQAKTPVLVLHLWADWCRPCRDEFPMLRELEARIKAAHPGQVQIVYVAEIPNGPQMDTFLKANRALMPPGPQYQDTAELLDRWLRPLLPDGHLTLPITLVLDDRRIVRHAMVGALRDRSVELSASIESLLAVSAR